MEVPDNHPVDSPTTISPSDPPATPTTLTASDELSVVANDPTTEHDAIPVPEFDEPLFWTRHGRSISAASERSLLRPPPIALEDHSDEQHVQTRACWARCVSVDKWDVVSGSTGVGAYIVWHCTVQTLRGGELKIRKRYSEFDRLRTDLVRAFPHAAAMIPPLPRKSIVSRFRPEFLEQRGAGLAHFLMQVWIDLS